MYHSGPHPSARGRGCGWRAGVRAGTSEPWTRCPGFLSPLQPTPPFASRRAPLNELRGVRGNPRSGRSARGGRSVHPVRFFRFCPFGGVFAFAVVAWTGGVCGDPDAGSPVHSGSGGMTGFSGGGGVAR